MWILTPEEEAMEYVSLHKSKSERAYKGGKIISIREATEEEIGEHQQLLEKIDEESMKRTGNRKIITFQIEKDWRVLWPKTAKKNPMSYKALGHL